MNGSIFGVSQISVDCITLDFVGYETIAEELSRWIPVELPCYQYLKAEERAGAQAVAGQMEETVLKIKKLLSEKPSGQQAADGSKPSPCYTRIRGMLYPEENGGFCDCRDDKQNLAIRVEKGVREIIESYKTRLVISSVKCNAQHFAETVSWNILEGRLRRISPCATQVDSLQEVRVVQILAELYLQIARINECVKKSEETDRDAQETLSENDSHAREPVVGCGIPFDEKVVHLPLREIAEAEPGKFLFRLSDCDYLPHNSAYRRCEVKQIEVLHCSKATMWLAKMFSKVFFVRWLWSVAELYSKQSEYNEALWSRLGRVEREQIFCRNCPAEAAIIAKVKESLNEWKKQFPSS